MRRLLSNFFLTDPRGLEVCGHGPGPSLPLDLHRGGAGWDGRHHPPGQQSSKENSDSFD